MNETLLSLERWSRGRAVLVALLVVESAAFIFMLVVLQSQAARVRFLEGRIHDAAPRCHELFEPVAM